MRRTFIIPFSFLILLTNVVLQDCVFEDYLLTQEDPVEEIVCSGKIKTMIYEAPMDVKWDGKYLKIKTKVREVIDPEILIFFDNLEVPVPEINGRYEMDVQYADGIFVSQLDENKFSVNHFHVNATLFLDQCLVEYPLEIDSLNMLNKLFEYYLLIP